MLEHQENQHEKGAPRFEHGTPAADARTHRAQIAAITPSYSNTRETNCDSNPLRAVHAVGVGLEVKAVDGTERGLITTNGKRSTLVLTPVPLDTASSRVALIDWLAFSIKSSSEEHDHIPPLLSKLKSFFGCPVAAVGKGKGWNGYTTRLDLFNGQDVPLGLIAFGGERQRDTIHVELNGHACALIQDWHTVAAWGESVGVITRTDYASDDMEGKIFTMEKEAEKYKRGEFHCGGRQPSHSLNGDWLDDGRGSPNGRTLNIGNRANGKMLRIYEKGKQLGDPVSPWVRIELELRAKNRVIPWESLTKPGNYLAGSFNCLNFLSEVQDKIRTIAKAATISYARSVELARLMVGKLVNVMMMVAGGDAFQVVSELNRDGFPDRLIGYVHLLPQIYAGGAS